MERSRLLRDLTGLYHPREKAGPCIADSVRQVNPHLCPHYHQTGSLELTFSLTFPHMLETYSTGERISSEPRLVT